MEFYPFVMILGIIATKAPLNLQTILLIIANLFILISTFIVNDIVDADDDALDPAKVNRNAISAGRITKIEANVFLVLIISISLIILIFVGLSAFAFGGIIIIIGLFYSIKPIRLKSYPIIDVLSHAFFLGSAEIYIFTTIYGAQSDLITMLIAGGVFLVSAGGDLYNEYRDWEVDRQVGLQNSASFLGFELTKKLNKIFNFLGISLIAIGVILGIVTYFNIQR